MIHNNARLLFGTCVLTPYELGFEPDGSNTIYVIVDTSFNFMFFIDIFVNFTSSFSSDMSDIYDSISNSSSICFKDCELVANLETKAPADLFNVNCPLN